MRVVRRNQASVPEFCPDRSGWRGGCRQYHRFYAVGLTGAQRNRRDSRVGDAKGNRNVIGACLKLLAYLGELSTPFEALGILSLGRIDLSVVQKLASYQKSAMRNRGVDQSNVSVMQ